MYFFLWRPLGLYIAYIGTRARRGGLCWDLIGGGGLGGLYLLIQTGTEAAAIGGEGGTGRAPLGHHQQQEQAKAAAIGGEGGNRRRASAACASVASAHICGGHRPPLWTDTPPSAARGRFRDKVVFIKHLTRHVGNKKASPKRG